MKSERRKMPGVSAATLRKAVTKALTLVRLA
jgi:hypothetical protein